MFDDADLIHRDTRADVLIDVTATAREAGFRLMIASPGAGASMADAPGAPL